MKPGNARSATVARRAGLHLAQSENGLDIWRISLPRA
jgi:hypothetical protein